MLSESLIKPFSFIYLYSLAYQLYFKNTAELICTLQSGLYPVAILIRVLGGERRLGSLEVRVEVGRDQGG